jgi:hypothetical protein
MIRIQESSELLLSHLTPYRFLILAIACLPFLQMGSSLFMSCQGFLVAVIIGLLLIRKTPIGIGSIWLLFASASFTISFSLYAEVSFNFLREIHFLLGGFLACWILSSSLKVNHGHVKIERIAGYMATFIFAFTLLQQLLIMSGTYLIIPVNWYVNSEDAALSERWVDHAMRHGLDLDIRVSAFFSEPSYLGLIAAVLYYIQQVNHERWQPIPCLIALGTSAVACTSLGFVANLALGLMFLSRRHATAVLISLLGIFAFAITMSSVSEIIGSRLQAIITGDDQSANVRIFHPLSILSLTWGTHIVGIPITGIEEALSNTGLFDVNGESPLQNGVFNFFFSFGMMAVPLLVMLLRKKNHYFVLIFMIIANQNGAFFELDKLVMYALTWIVTPDNTPFFLNRDDADAPTPRSTNS